MDILVVTPHTDDFIYGLGGTLITHADDDIHIVAVSSIQQSAARDVADAFGATIEFLDAPYHRISDEAQRVKEALAEILRERRPTYVFGPPANGDWTADHTTTGRALLGLRRKVVKCHEHYGYARTYAEIGVRNGAATRSPGSPSLGSCVASH